MFESPRRGRQARNFTTNVPKILDRKIVFRTDIFRKLSLGAPVNSTITSTNFSAILILGSCLLVSRLQCNGAWVPGLLLRDFLWFTFLSFFSIRLTDPVRNAFDVKRKKKGWPNLKPQTWRSKLSRKKTGPGSYSSNDPRSSNILSGREATRGALLPTLPPPPTQKTTVG